MELRQPRQVRKEATATDGPCDAGCPVTLSIRTAGGILSYEVIARKWRPPSFQDLVGQDHVARTLLNAVRSDKLHHTLLFTGVRGTGKTSSARILAKVLRCQNLDSDLRPCGQCSDCVEIAESRSSSVIEIDGASNNGVDSVRELRESVRYAPISGRWKIYIIDEVHMLSTAAFNALLKTLEEPPAHVVFVLATTEVQKIPATILGRCQRFDFRRIPTRLIHQHLQRISEKEGLRAETEALWMIARQADGSMRDGQSLLDQCSAYGNGELSLAGVSEALGLTDRALILGALTAILSRNSSELLNLLKTFSVSAIEPRRFAQELLEEIRHTLMARLAPEQAPDLIDLPESEIAALVELSKGTSESDLHLLFDIALKGAHDISRSTDPHLVLEILMLRMVQAPRLVPISQIDLPGAQQPTAAARSAPPVTKAPPADVASSGSSAYTMASFVRSAATGEAVDLRQLEASQSLEMSPEKSDGEGATTEPLPPQAPARPTDPWSLFVERMKETNGLLAAMLDNTNVLEQSAERLVIGVPTKMQFFVDKLRAPDNIKKIEDALKVQWQQTLQVEIRLISEARSPKPVEAKAAETVAPTMTPSPRDQREEAAALQKKETEDLAIQNPLVQSAQSVFKTKVKSIQDMSKGARQ